MNGDSKVLQWLAEGESLPTKEPHEEPPRKSYDKKIVAWLDMLGIRAKIKNGYDKYGFEIREGDKVRGVFYQQMPVDAVCRFKNGAFGLEWNRGEIKEFHAFCQMCNVEYEVVE